MQAPTLAPLGGNNPLTKLADFSMTNRRVAIIAVLDGESPGCLDTPTLKEWACVLMLHPMNIGGSDRPMWIEYIGSVEDDPSTGYISPCGTNGIPGGNNAQGPKVPTLVQ